MIPDDVIAAKSDAVCPYCGAGCAFVSIDYVYGPGRFDGYLLICKNYPQCDAFVGCHNSTFNPKGRLANKQLRLWKGHAHTHFDRLWKKKGFKRGQAYKWLSNRLGITADECHIGMFDVDKCKKVVEICADGNVEVINA